jgi:hypothetical protein
MGRYFALALGLSTPHQAPKSQIISDKIRKRSKSVVKNSAKIGLLIASLLAVCGIFYLVEVNSTSTKGYEIKTLEKQLTELKETNKRLELEVSSLKAIQNLETTVQTLNLVPSGAMKYAGGRGYAFEN